MGVEGEEGTLAKGSDNVSTQRAAVAAHLAGYGWDVIAANYGYDSAKSAQMAIEKLLGETFTSSDLTSARNKALARKESLVKAMWWDAMHPFMVDTDTGKVTDERNEAHMAAVDRTLRALEGIDRLLGLNAPTQVEIYRPGAQEFMEIVGELKQRALEGMPKEGDIFDAEVIDDEDQPR